MRDEGQRHRLGSGGDDALVEADRGLRAVLFDLDHVRAGEAAVARHHLHLAALGQPGQAAGQLLDNQVLPAAQLVEIHHGRVEGDAVAGHLLGLGDDLGGVQQRLGGDAADVEADAAEGRVALDQHDLLAEVCGPEGGGVAARAGTEHHDLGMDVAARRGGNRRRRGGLRRGRGVSRAAAPAISAVGAARLDLARARTCACGLQRQDQCAFRHPVARLHRNCRDPAGGGRGHLHRRLVGLKLDQRLFLGHLIAHGHEDADDRHVLEIANIGNLDFHDVALPYSMIRRTSPSRCRSVAAKRAASAPSTARWS